MTKKAILVIDDEESHLQLLRDALGRKDYEVFATSDPAEGFQMLKDNDIKLVLLDIRMPKKTGFDLYKEFEEYQTVPVLFVTGFPEEFSAESDEVIGLWRHQFMAGTTDILYKPFDLPLLYEKVESLIGK